MYCAGAVQARDLSMPGEGYMTFLQCRIVVRRDGVQQPYHGYHIPATVKKYATSAGSFLWNEARLTTSGPALARATP